MRAINTKAKAAMDMLTARCKQLGDRDRFHTKPYMDVEVEYVDQCALGPMFCVTHYYYHMADPEMCFIKGGDGEYYPYYSRQDILRIERECVQWDEEGNVQRVDINKQDTLAVIAETWMRSIARQQQELVK